MIASLVYLASQIRQNTSAMRGAAHESSVARNTSWLVAIGSSAQASDLLSRGHRDYASLSDSERLQYSHLVTAMLLGGEATFHQYKRGNLEAAIWERSLASFPAYAALAGFRSAWQRGRASFSPEFRAIVDAAMEEAATRPGTPPA